MSFFDSTGQPWPVQWDTNSNPAAIAGGTNCNVQTNGNAGGPAAMAVGFFVCAPTKGSNVLEITPVSLAPRGGLVVSLEGAPKPLTFLLVTGGGRYDANLSVHVADRGPHAKVEIITRPDAPDTGAPFLTGMLQGVPPADATPLAVEAFHRMAPRLAPRAQCLSAHALHAALARMDGLGSRRRHDSLCRAEHARRSVVRQRPDGVGPAEGSFLMSGVLKMRGGALLSSAGRAGPRRLAVIAMSGTAIVALVVVVALSGHKAVPVSQDARMKPVDPLPGGLHSTPEMNALGFEADTQQAQAALKRGESYTPALAPSVPMFPSPAAPDLTTPAPTPAPAPQPVRQPHAVAPVRVVMPQEVIEMPTPTAAPAQVIHVQAVVDPKAVEAYQQADRRPVQPMGRPASEDRNGPSADGAGGRPQRSGPERQCGHWNHGALSACCDAGIAAVGRADRSCARSSGTRRIRSPHSGAEFGSVEPCRHAGR